MTSAEVAMTPGSDEDWARRSAARRRRQMTLFGILFAAGLATGFLVGYLEEPSAGLLDGGTIPPVLAIGATVAALVLVIWGSVRIWRQADELERQIQSHASIAAANVAMLGYIGWFLLWKGGLVGEPSAHVIFLATVLVSSGVYLWRKAVG